MVLVFRISYREGVQLDSPPTPIDPAAPRPTPEPVVGDPDGRIVGGVCALLADRLGVDALWVRIAFVVLALTGGIGLVAYAGLWLALVAGPTSGWNVATWTGGALIVVGIPILLNGSRFSFMTGPLAVLILLVGLTLALWQPRRQIRPMSPPAWTSPAFRSAVRSAPVETEGAVSPEPKPRRQRDPRPPRERSILGRAAFGLAIVVAATGALIDQANGGRIHPEQWLGGAAFVCGVGTLLGAVRGRARWLIVPALVFAVVGYGSGLMARMRIDASDAMGDRSAYIQQGTSRDPIRESVGIGTVYLNVDSAPTKHQTVDTRVAIGEINIGIAEGVTVEIRGRLEHGDLHVNGDVQTADTTIIGPNQAPDVTIDAWIGRGNIVVWQYDNQPIIEPRPATPELGPLTPIANYVSATDDGWIVLADGYTMIDPDNTIVTGEAYQMLPDGSYNVDPSESNDGWINVVGELSRSVGGPLVLPTPVGEFRLLPRSLLLTPEGAVLDLQAIRAELAASAGVQP
jgi:phage shock protein PspC (stress-responsive transcriptional regulator)